MTKREMILEKYLMVCRHASKNDDVFKDFKSLPDYYEVLEHLSKKLGYEHLQLIQRNNPNLLSNDWLYKFLRNDMHGNPTIADFGSLRCSPTTLQYISVLSNLIDKFKSLKDFKIVEIGGGYGGQCKIIQDYFSINCYDIIDLADVLLLQEKYLKTLNCFDCVELFSDTGFAAINYDLVISNYALSEVSIEDQLKYVNKILLNTTHGYITCNQPLSGLHLLQEKFETLKIEDDIEGERKENYLITW